MHFWTGYVRNRNIIFGPAGKNEVDHKDIFKDTRSYMSTVCGTWLDKPQVSVKGILEAAQMSLTSM